ncbi:dual specificity protein kinase Ttk-like isoform X1 [Oncorhynchus tshawytscha]|uniref:dual specificity protein kinase Ttk-like isoform X1 n=1 Tax=Oncorhynchus tshawytscha TaxID=74940 RepID=UPI000D0A38CA|nr:dual specificity protein kinase Ttk-like isoform X1 [Oncorhynchus tshawytscha]
MTMLEEEHTDRQHQLAMLCQKLDRIKTRCLIEDDTDNINQAIGSNSPETCLAYLMVLEKKGDPHLDASHLTKLTDFYTRVFSTMPLGKHCQNESYAKMLVRFAELNVIQDPSGAEGNFNVATTHCQDFAFVHIAHAQFELSQGNTKKSTWILQRAIELNAKPNDLLEAAMQNLTLGKAELLSSEDKENVPVSTYNINGSAKNGKEFRKVSRDSDGTGDLQLSSIFSSGTMEPRNGPLEDQAPAWRSGSQRKRAVGIPGRVPVVHRSIYEMDDDDSDGRQVKRREALIPSSLSRQTSGSSAMFTLSSAQKRVEDGDFLNLKTPIISPEPRPWEDMGMVDSTTTLLHRQDRRDATRVEDTTDHINQIIGSNSPEACRLYLTKLEKRGNPQTDTNLLLKLKDCYSRVFSRLPLGMYSKNESYAKMLVRFAELKGIDDPDDARDNFIVVRSNCKGFAFVHIAHAQFEVAQGQVKKGTSILQKALQVNAKPTELIETAMQKLKVGNYQFLPAEDRESVPEPQSHGSLSLSNYGRERELEIPARLPLSQTQPKPSSMELSSGWKMPARVSRVVSPEEKHTPPDLRPIPRLADSLPTPSLPLPSRLNPPVTCQTPNYKDPRANCYVTPVVKRNPPFAAPLSAAHKAGPAQQQPCTPLSQVSYAQQTHQGSTTALSNESIVIKGKQFLVLKMIGRGGSSKVYQVLDQRNQLFAVKYVNLEEADPQTVESYKNEIEHLNHLQQYSDQIIKLYDYEITNSYIYMLMECGNLDLNTWLRNRKTVNPLERKFYWKNMLEAVQTIHKHGIVHSDLKPANFVIVNASLKLIDFGIANRIQPDVTSIMKDSQVGTLNYMPPEAIKDTSSQPGKARFKISTKGDVWSLGCIMYCMTYGKTPFQTITNQITKLHAIIDPTHEIEFPDIAEKDLLDVLKRCLVRNPRERISIVELLEHSYLKLQSQQQSPVPAPPDNNDLKRILNELAALQSPNSIARATNNLAKMCNSGRKLDAAGCVKSSSLLNWKM